MQKTTENSGVFRIKVGTHFLSLHWNGNAFRSTVGFRGEANHEVFQRHLLSFCHILSDVWNILSDTENRYILFQRTHAILLIYVQYTSKHIRPAFESTRYMVTRMKAFCLPLLIYCKQIIVVLLSILILSLPWELLEKVYLKREIQEPSSEQP